MSMSRQKHPNVVLVFADQWRAQATGYAGDPNVRTPNLDQLAGQAINCTHAVSGYPVCSPARASLLTGQYPHTHGVFINDVCLDPDAVTMAKLFKAAGYDTAYIGKWHLDGHGRSGYIPPQRRQGFDYWKVLECTHNYNDSPYYAGESPRKCRWSGYDAIAQTRDAHQYMAAHDRQRPFLLALSWGPPHNPYETAPAPYNQWYDPTKMILRPNVPDSIAAQARQWLVGYYAHCSALDTCVGDLLASIDQAGLAEDTIFLFFSDHGDMLGSQGQTRKQRPWDESIRIPFLLRYPRRWGWQARRCPVLIDMPDVLPTLLGLCDLPIPSSVEGRNCRIYLDGQVPPADDAALLACYHPFSEWLPAHGGRAFRGLRTDRHTYVRDLRGPWLLYDNNVDPYQQTNLIGEHDHADVQAALDRQLLRRLATLSDRMLPGGEYIRRWKYTVGKDGAAPYTD